MESYLKRLYFWFLIGPLSDWLFKSKICVKQLSHFRSVTDHVARDQALHWCKKAKIIEIGEKKLPLGSLWRLPIFFSILFSFFFSFFAFFPTAESGPRLPITHRRYEAY